MIINFGKHKGKTAEELVLKNPDYIAWVLKQTATGPMASLQVEAHRLIDKFDRKPLVEPCAGKCGNVATRASIYNKTADVVFWCNNCPITSLGASQHKLSVFSQYMPAISYINNYCNGRAEDLRDLIKALARARGLPNRVGANQAIAFFT